MKRIEVKIGDIFGNKKVIGDVFIKNVGKQRHSFVKVQCLICEYECETSCSALKRESRPTCKQCNNKRFLDYINNNNHKKTHGKTKTKLYYIWHTMKNRCYNVKNKSYKYYGGKGITVCEEWKKDFVIFETWAFENGYKEGLSIDRIDNNKGYEPSNCQWITLEENVNKEWENRKNTNSRY